MTVCPAAAQLVELARVMRPEWDGEALRGALARARAAGWPWPRAFLAAARLLADEEAGPGDLDVLVRDVSRVSAPPPGVARRGAALARRRLGECQPPPDDHDREEILR